MNDALNPLKFRTRPGDLVAELASRAPYLGPNQGLWQGLTIYRFPYPLAPQWEEVQSLSLCVIAQGRQCVTIDGNDYYCDPFQYLALGNNLHFQAEILEASPAKPFLSLVFQIDPAMVHRVSSDILLGQRTTAFTRSRPPKGANYPFVSALDYDLLDAILRFLRALSIGADSHVLAPIYMNEIVYRVLQAGQYTRLIEMAARESASNPISAIIAYVHDHIAEPLSVSDLAEQASMSPSAFSHLFRDVTGKSPYQFVKEMRLNRARELLIENKSSITQISKAVGYRSTSHFINEFRERYGITPRAYSDVQSLDHERRTHKNARRA